MVRMVTGREPMARNRPAKSARWKGSSLASAARRSASVSATIISRIGPIFPSPKNMCSVRQRPMPSAPSFTAISAWSGWSALARTPRRRALSAQPSRRAYCR